ncbi:MAG TPA: RNA methyltransferase [Thermoanaerobaculia bacterium]|jgi:TrmH family RNA methyltransferase
MKSISSRQNTLYKRIREAIREHDSEIVIEGPKPVADAIAAGWRPLAIVTRGESERRDAVAFSHELFDSLAETRSPQSVIGLFSRKSGNAAEIFARCDSVAVALDGVQDPGNVGTIVRLAAAFDASGVLLLPSCADPFGPKAIRSSVGAVLNVPIANVTATELIASGLPLFATAMHGSPADPPAREAILLFGNEGAGVSEELLRHSALLSIPMSGRVESLNVASSAAILLSRSFAQRATR